MTTTEPTSARAPADPVGFAGRVRPHLPAMTRLAARLAPYADHDDVVQEALVRAWEEGAQYDRLRGRPAGWLLAITADQASGPPPGRRADRSPRARPGARPASPLGTP